LSKLQLYRCIFCFKLTVFFKIGFRELNES